MGAISMHRLTPFLEIYFSCTVRFMSQNIVIFALKLAKFWRFDPILDFRTFLTFKQKLVNHGNQKFKI